MLDYEKKKRHDNFLGDVSKLIESVKKVGYSSLKEEAVLVQLRALERQTKKEESVYKKETKTKKRRRVVFVLMVIVGLFLIIDQKLLQVLPSWSMNVYGFVVIIFFLSAMLSQDLRNLK